jgi:hypothetical protein
MTNVTTFFLPADVQVTLTFDISASGHYVNIGNPGDQPTGFTAISASDVVVIGPFNNPRNYRVTLVSGSYTSSESYVAPDFTGNYDDLTNKPTLGTMAAEDAADYTVSADFATVATSGNYTDLNITPETLIATIGNTATGTQIATAVNAIIAALQAKSLVSSS